MTGELYETTTAEQIFRVGSNVCSDVDLAAMDTDPVNRLREHQHPISMDDLNAAAEPIELFKAWMAEAEASEPNDPNAAALATSHLNVPSVRMVLVKGLKGNGVRFFTNAESQKGRELHENPFASLCFHWKSLRKQVRFSGKVRLLERGEVEEYFHSRSRKSQIAAAVSQQSRPLGSRAELEKKVAEYTKALGEAAIPLPKDWVGYVLDPIEIEFWSDGPDRLHDRKRFKSEAEKWCGERLYP